MPIYEYRCQECGHDLEKLQRMSDDPLRDCPECGEPALKRLVSAAGFRLKGGGWYETDFKKDNKRNLAEGGDGGKSDKKEGGDGKPSSDKGDSKTDTTTKKASGSEAATA